MEYTKNIAKGLRSLRAEHQSTQTLLGDVLKIGQSQYSRLEAGSRSLCVEDLIPLANHYNLTIVELVNRLLEDSIQKSTNQPIINNLQENKKVESEQRTSQQAEFFNLLNSFYNSNRSEQTR